MNDERATILFREKPNKFTVWEVDLPAPLIQQARRAQNTATGDLDFILDQLPIGETGVDSPCQFLFKDGSTYALFSMEMGPGFFDKYCDEGVAVCGGKAGVIAEVEELLQEQAQCWGQSM